MIAKHIRREPDELFGVLAQRLFQERRGARHLDHLWMVNCYAGDGLEDLRYGIIEIEATQWRNQRVTASKSYYLMVGLRNEAPSLEVLAEIERAFASALGFEDHQCIASLHRLGDRRYLHIAYNKIHRTSFLCHTPFRDYPALARVCREMETRFDLAGEPEGGLQ